MATSGSVDFSVTRDDLINSALQHIGVLGEGETASSDQLTESARILNMIVKLRQSDGMQLWALKKGYILPFTGSNDISSGSHVVTAYDTTTLSSDSATSDTTLTVTSITGFTNGDTLGIELDDGSVDWTTINGVPAGSTITITTGVTSAASSGNRVYGYTASSERVTRPLRILNAFVKDVANNTGHQIDVVARNDFYNIATPTTEGEPNRLYYNPQLSTGTFSVWPRFEDGSKIIEFSYHRPFEDFDSASDTPDFPQEWYLPLFWELAYNLAPSKGVPLEERKGMIAEAERYLQLAREAGTAEESIRIVPDVRN